MGLFSESVTQVGTNITRVISDIMLPSSIKSGVAKSILDDDPGQMVEYAMDGLVKSIGMRAERMYEYGRNGYTYGTPSASIVTSVDAKAQVMGIIEASVGGPVILDYYHFGTLNPLHVGWTTIFQSLGYVQSSNELTVLTASKDGLKVYLKDMQVVVVDATVAELSNGSLAQWGTPANAGYTPAQKDLATAGTLKAATPFMLDPNAGADCVNLTYVWEESINVVVGTVTTYDAGLNPIITNVTETQKVLRETTSKITLAGYDLNADWHQAKYTRNGVTGYWLYKAGTDTHPSVDAVYAQDHDPLGNFFPFGYFRFNKTSMAANPSSPEFKSSKKLTGYLGMDFASMIESIHTSPDINNVEQAMVMMAVPAKTTDPMEQRYLFDFFSRLYDTIGGNNAIPATTVEGQDVMTSLGMGIAEGNIIIQDKRFKMALGYRNVIKRAVAGNIGKIGTYSSSYANISVEQKGVSRTGEAITITVNVPCYTYRCQITEVLYEEVLVFNLKTTYYIFDQYTTTGDKESVILMVPLDHSITENYSIPDREVLYARSLHYVFNSRVVSDLEWYQTGIFQAILLIVAIVITVMDFGSDGGSVIGAALGLTGVSALAATIIVNIIIGQLLTVVFTMFVRVFGQKFALLVAVVAIMYGAYQVADTGSLVGAPWATEMLQAANGLTNAVMQDKYNDLLNEGKALGLLEDAQTKKLDEANKLLEHNNYLTTMFIFGESPDDFYQRTVHSGNIGILGIDAISSFVDISLTLPKLNDTVGN